MTNAPWTPKRIAVLLALALPVLGTLGMIVRGERALRGSEWRFPIAGYDPRDLLRGHYLTYRIEWGEEPGGAPCNGCCLCLTREGGKQRVTRLECVDAASCDAHIAVWEIDQLQRFYIPEGSAADLDAAVRGKRAEILLSAVGGNLVIKDLLIDGKPWDEIARH